MTIEVSARHSPDLDLVLVESRCGCLSTESRFELLRSAQEIRLSGGDFVPAAEPPAERRSVHGQPGLVVEGLLRIFVRSEPRQVTLQYAADGEMFGIPALHADCGVSGITAGGQALVDSRILLFCPDTIDELILRDTAAADMVIRGLRSAFYTGVSLMAENVLWPLRQRVARHLLDMAVRQGSDVVVPVTVQDLADATGTVREVVTRLLKDMREQRLVGRKSGSLVLLDLRALHVVARGESAEAAAAAPA